MQILTQQSEGKGVQASDPPQHPVLDSVSFRKESLQHQLPFQSHVSESLC